MITQTLDEQVSDDMSRLKRQSAIDQLTSQLTTEDLELIGKHFPHLIECALHEILNPNCADCASDSGLHSVDGRIICKACILKTLGRL